MPMPVSVSVPIAVRKSGGNKGKNRRTRNDGEERSFKHCHRKPDYTAV